MAFSVLAADLLEAVRILNLAPSESGTPSSDFFLARPSKDSSKISLTVAGSVMAQVRLNGSGEWPLTEPFYIPRQLFSDWVNEAKRSNNPSSFDFTLKEKLIITNGNRKTGYEAYSAIAGYVDLPEFKNASLELSPELIRFLECASICATTEKQNASLACVYLSSSKDTVELLATNQPTIIRIKTKASLKEQIIFPVNMVDVLKADGLKSLHWNNDSIVGKFSKGCVWHPLLLAAKDFPVNELRTVMDDMQKEPLVVRLSLNAMSSILSTVSNYLTSVRKDDWRMVVFGKSGSSKMQLTVKLPYCTFREEVACQPIKSDFRFLWPIDYVAPVLSFMDKMSEEEIVEVRLAKAGSATVIKCGQTELMISTEDTK